MSRKISLEELAEHNGKKDSHWIALYGKVYDVSSFVKKHPGGVIIESASGREGTILYESYHPGYSQPKLQAVLKSLPLVGQIDKAEPIPNDEFFVTVRARVEAHLKQKGYTRHYSDLIGVGEAMLTLVLYFIAWYYAVFHLSFIAACWAGYLTGRMGFLMHMGLHAAISSSSTWNYVVGLFHNLIGSSWKIWTMEHQVAHHTHPNEFGKDNDYSIGDPFLRFNRFIKYTPLHKFNHVITILAMAGGTWRWYFADFGCIWNGEVGSVKWYTNAKDFATICVWKAFWFLRWVVLPVYFWGFWRGMVPSMVIQVIAAYKMENIFIVNHIQTDLEPDPSAHWAVRNSHTTTNWSSGSVFWNWFSGGLNHQVEHHLFPSISHHLYPLIQPVVLQTSKEFNIPYYNFENYNNAWFAMFRHLETLAYEENDPKRPPAIVPRDYTKKTA